MHCQLVSNLHGQYFVMVRHHHWPPDIPRQPPVPIDDEWGARIFIRLLDVDAHQWRYWVDSTQVDPRLDEIAFTAAAIRELARGQFSIYPIQQEAFLRTIPKACTFQNHRDPDDEQHEYAIIPPTVALVKPGYDPVPLLVARRLLRAWTATADIEQLTQMLTLLQLPHATTAPVAALITALLDGLNAGGICLVRIRRRSTKAPANNPEFLPFVHRPVPLAPPAQPAPIGAVPQPVSLYTPAMGQAGNANSAQKGAPITDAELALAKEGKFLDFWRSRHLAGDPVARTALTGWGDPDFVGAGLSEKLAAAYTWRNLSSYIADNGLTVSMEQIGAELALAHANAVIGDGRGISNLLSPTQVAGYHHSVFRGHGIPAHVFGGTHKVPFVSVPVQGGWGSVMFDANTYSGLWCKGCDSTP